MNETRLSEYSRLSKFRQRTNAFGPRRTPSHAPHSSAGLKSESCELVHTRSTVSRQELPLTLHNG